MPFSNSTWFSENGRHIQLHLLNLFLNKSLIMAVFNMKKGKMNINKDKINKHRCKVNSISVCEIMKNNKINLSEW